MPIERPSDRRRLLIYEPRTEGHHPGWLRFITEDLLSAGYELVLAVDLRPPARKIIQDHLGDLVPQVELIPSVDDRGRPRNGSTQAALAATLAESGASRVFMGALDEMASSAFRRAAVGILPPPVLQGRIGGIYHRPRFTVSAPWSLNRFLKATGFKRLMRGGWFDPLLILDEYLARDLATAYPDTPIGFLPDPCPDHFAGDADRARSALDLPDGPVVYLFFGVGARRKGLHLAVDAMLRLDRADTFLLVAGRQNPPPRVRRGLDRLCRQGRARVMDRYVSSEEEKRCFQACDVVLLPYLNHFGTSGILSRAMAAGKPVIASDEHLLGRLVKSHGIGWHFPPGDVTGLMDCLARSADLGEAASNDFAARTAAYTRRYSRKAYRNALLAAVAGAFGRS